MGVCSSCLGGDRIRDRDLSDEDESSRLLFDDPHGNYYGSIGEHNASLQADPLEVQRETEALQKVVTQTSHHLVDIFALVSQNPPRASAVRYQDVLSKLSLHNQSIRPKQQHPNENTPSASEGWLSEDEEEEDEMKSCKLVKSDGIGSILGGFADADSTI